MCLYKAAGTILAAISWLASSPVSLRSWVHRRERKKRREKGPHSCHQSAGGDSVIQSDSEKPVNRHCAATAAAVGDVLKWEQDETPTSASVGIKSRSRRLTSVFIRGGAAAL